MVFTKADALCSVLYQTANHFADRSISYMTVKHLPEAQYVHGRTSLAFDVKFLSCCILVKAIC